MADKEDLKFVLQQAVNALGFVFVGHEYVPSPRSAVLRVYIDKPGAGITIDECALVSRHLNTVLDVADIMRGRYNLEVSSPGINRPLFELAQYHDYIGKTLKLRLHSEVNGQKNMRVILNRVGDHDIVVTLEDDELCLPFSAIKRANVQVNNE